jgi:cytohesin
MDGAREMLDAVEAGDLVRVKALVEAKSELVNARDEEGMTPLLFVARDGRAKLAAFLITHGADIEATDDDWKDTPLGWAVFYGRKEVAEVLLAKGANVNHRIATGDSLLSLALAGEKGEWAQWSSATKEKYRALAELLRQHGGTN